MNPRKSLLYLIVWVGIFVILFPVLGAGFFTEWLWFKDLGFETLFVTRLQRQILWGFAGGALFAISIFVNISIARRSRRVVSTATPMSRGPLFTLLTKLSAPVLSLAAGIVAGAAVWPHWLTIESFLLRTVYNDIEPLFGKDISFYLFDLPFWMLIYRFVFAVLDVCLVTAVITYLFSGLLSFEGRRFDIHSRVRPHLGILGALILGLKGIGYWLYSYHLVYSPRGVAFGASYTDVFAHLPGLRLLMVLSFVAAILVLIAAFTRNLKLLLWPVAGLIAASLIFGNLVPGVLQNFVVSPNELAKETPFIERNIAMTKKGFGLARVVEKEYPATSDLTWEKIQANRDIISNIRLWDWRPARQTFGQIQEIRLYYNFNDVDIDRYVVDGQYRQVILSAREMDHTRLPSEAQTWVNRHLKFTHGYGIVMAPASGVSPQGLPEFYIRDIPPISVGNLKVERPEIYFGELTQDYVIVKSKEKEFDYPVADANAETVYQADSGVKVSPILNRLALAVRFGDYQILFSGAITPESRILFRRQVADRVRALAPFLVLDRDPYVVLDGGKVYWIIDAYTVSTKFPYSQPHRLGFNYMRNSVKAVVDAYTGKVTLYQFDKQDPIISTYSKIFPGVFRDMAEMPEGIKAHLRYPEDLFLAQADIYSTYHMNNATVYYNKEDYWAIPEEVVGAQKQPVEPYYVVTRLPGEPDLEFALILPFTPREKGNMNSWLAARCDPEHLGELNLYKFPKQRIVYGPMQVEGFIDQDSQISQSLTLWGQVGSEVIRGNLLVIPMDGSILYVEPLFLQAKDNKLPELKRVIVGYGGKVVMRETLESALQELFGVRQRPPEEAPQAPLPEQQTDLPGLVKRARELYNQAQQRIKEGDWAEYGRLIAELGNILNTLNEVSGGAR